MKNRILQFIEDSQKTVITDARVKIFEDAAKKPLTEGQKKKIVPTFEIGDTIDVHQRILEGQKERIQIFSGVVIARRGEGLAECFTVRRIVQSEGVERVFPLMSPRIAKIEVKRSGKVRRAKLFYLRDRVGKATRLKERKSKVVVPEGDTAADLPLPNPSTGTKKKKK